MIPPIIVNQKQTTNQLQSAKAETNNKAPCETITTNQIELALII